MRRLSLRGRSSGCILMLTLCVALGASPVHAQNAKPDSSGAAKQSVKAKAPAKKPAAKPQPAPAPAASAGGEQFGDGIAAVVNKEVITMRDLREASQRTAADLQQHKIQVPPDDVLQRQVLQQLIMDRLQEQEARRLGIALTDAQVDQAVGMIADRNRLTVDQLKAEIAKTGASWDGYRKSIREEIRTTRLRQRMVDSNITITDGEVDAFLKEHARAAAAAPAPQPVQPAPAPAQPTVAIVPNGPIALAQILVRVPEGASSEDVDRLRKKAEGLLARARKGEDFASLAAANSDGPEALQGGQMGARPIDGWPDLFVQAVRGLRPGQVSGLVRSGNGFHILKVMARAMQQIAAPTQAAPAPAADEDPIPPESSGAVQITQTHARHILIKLSAVMNDEQAREKLDDIRRRIVEGGVSFADMASQYSQDSTAPQGGDLGWLDPGETVRAFEQVMDKLQPGEISQPVASPFGWHLIQVLERRQHDATEDVRRNRARQILLERRAQPAFEDYLDQLRAQSYVDNRLEKQDQLQQRYQQ
ncbi:MAG TPA: peptidylprolyl isomerase [Bordetella sp.]